MGDLQEKNSEKELLYKSPLEVTFFDYNYRPLVLIKAFCSSQ